MMDPNFYFINTEYENVLSITPLEPYFPVEQITNIHPFQISTPTFNEELILSTLTPNSIFKDTNYLGFDDNIFDSNDSKYSDHDDNVFDSKFSEHEAIMLDSRLGDHADTILDSRLSDQEDNLSDSRFSDQEDDLFDSNDSTYGQEPLPSPIHSPSLKTKKSACECSNCGTTNTPLWRRNPEGEPLCNACGLFYKLHGKVRPLSLKTNVIKKRNRTSTSTHRSKKKKKSHSKRKY